VPKPCSVCIDRRVEQINSDLKEGKSVLSVAREAGIPDSNVYRHRKNCLQSVRFGSTVVATAALSSIEFLEAREKELVELFDEALKRKSYSLAADIVTRRIRLRETIANLSGEVKPRQKTVVNLHLDKATAERVALSYLKHRELTGGKDGAK
jgi:hypothetical protein